MELKSLLDQIINCQRTLNDTQVTSFYVVIVLTDKHSLVFQHSYQYK